MLTREIVATKTKQYTVDDIRALECNPATEHRYFYVIDGELLEDPMPNKIHGRLQTKISRYLDEFVEIDDSGEVVSAGSHYRTDALDTTLIPDVAYSSHERLASTPDYEYIRVMPDIAVEIKSPSNTFAEQRRKAQAYLRNGSTLVWLVFPDRQGVEVWQRGEDGGMTSKFIDRHGALRGDPALPGFTLELSRLFPPEHDGETHAR